MATWRLAPETGQAIGTNTDMPLLVQPSILAMGAITLTEAQSSRFYSDEALTIELAREVVGADEIHVKVPSVSSTTEIWMVYDGILPDYAATDTFGAQNVWSDYAGVWHLNSIVDSAGNNADLSTFGSITVGSYSTVPFGGNATDFDGIDDYLTAPNSAFTNVGTGDFTTQAWIRPEVIQFQPYFVKGDRTGGQDTYAQDFYNISGNARFGFLLQDTNSGFTNFIPTTNYGINTWYYHTTTFDRDGSGTVYINGGSIGSQSLANETGSIDASGALCFGVRQPSSPLNFLNGQLKELRLRKEVIFPNWITTEYNNQYGNATFWNATELASNTSIKSIAGVLHADIGSMAGIIIE